MDDNPLKALMNSVLGRKPVSDAATDPAAPPAPTDGSSPGRPVWLPEHGPIDPNNFLSFSMPVFWGARDPERVNQLIAELVPLLAGGFHFADNLLTWLRNISFLDDPRFRKAYEDNIQNTSDAAIAWRRYIIACAGYHCVQIEGDFVECGVYRATGIKTVVDYLGGKQFPKEFYGYDTYDYNPVPGHSFEGQELGFYDEILKRFEGYPQVHLIKGLIPESFKEKCPDKIAYLHIDLNNAQSEIAALEVLFDRVVTGGIIVLDDYEWAGVYRAQKVAEDPWLEKRRHHVFPLPTGQGLIFKRGPCGAPWRRSVGTPRVSLLSLHDESRNARLVQVKISGKGCQRRSGDHRAGAGP